MGLTLEQALARIPFLKDARDLRTTELKGGITNRNYKIESGGKAYVLRITGEGTDLLGIRRDVEYAANKAAGELGVAPEVYYFIEPEGYLLTRFITGKHIPPEEISKRENVRRVAEKLRLFHTRAPALQSEFNAFRAVESLVKVSRAHQAKFPADFGDLMGRMEEVEAAFLRNPYAPTPCHCDLLNLNFMDEEMPGGRKELRILDWEYAGMGDIFFDLANFSHHHRLSDEIVRELLQQYFGEAKPRDFARLKLMWPVSELREALWGTTQTGISKLDEDFQGYADLWFAHAREDMSDPRWPQWLEDVTRT
jgi:thiamine kinase-like enzyme